MIVHRPPFIIHQFARIGSTNDILKEMADAPEFTCVVADEQTAGRGRRDRVWHSSSGDGLYLSILLRPELSPKIPLLSLMTAIAVAESLIEHDVAGVDIKWPNDVLINERKVCGILIEGLNSGGHARVIAGIGVNLNHQSFPLETLPTATSVRMESGEDLAVDAFRDQLLDKFGQWYARWKAGDDHLITHRWQQLSSYGRGCHITAILDNEQFNGVTAGLNEDGALLVQVGDGQFRSLLAGEVIRFRKSLPD